MSHSENFFFIYQNVLNRIIQFVLYFVRLTMVLLKWRLNQRLLCKLHGQRQYNNLFIWQRSEKTVSILLVIHSQRTSSSLTNLYILEI